MTNTISNICVTYFYYIIYSLIIIFNLPYLFNKWIFSNFGKSRPFPLVNVGQNASGVHKGVGTCFVIVTIVAISLSTYLSYKQDSKCETKQHFVVRQEKCNVQLLINQCINIMPLQMKGIGNG